MMTIPLISHNRAHNYDDYTIDISQQGLLNLLEEELTSFFQEWPSSVYISQLSNSFERMILHAVCQYLRLSSRSEHAIILYRYTLKVQYLCWVLHSTRRLSAHWFRPDVMAPPPHLRVRNGLFEWLQYCSFNIAQFMNGQCICECMHWCGCHTQ